MIKADTREQIKGYIEGFIQSLIDANKRNDLKPTDLRPLKTFSATGDIKPFHEAILPNGILLVNEFERSFSTKLGNTFEETAKLIGKDVYAEADRGHRIRGQVSNSTVAVIETIVDQINHRSMKKTYLELVDQVISVPPNDQIERQTIADLYLRDRDGNELFFEIKSPKPNKGQCLEVYNRLLHIHALRKQGPPKVKTYYAMAYNPNGNKRSDYSHAFSKNYLDLENQVLMGNEFWDMIGGPGTYEEVLDIYREVGKEKGPNMIRQLALE